MSVRQERRAREKLERKEGKQPDKPDTKDVESGIAISWTLSIDGEGNTNVTPAKNVPPVVQKDFFLLMWALRGALNAITKMVANENRHDIMNSDLFIFMLGVREAMTTIIKDHVSDEKSPLTEIYNKIQSPIVQAEEKRIITDLSKPY